MRVIAPLVALLLVGGLLYFMYAAVSTVLHRRKRERLNGTRDAMKLKAALKRIEELAYNAQPFEPVLAEGVLREIRKVT